MKNTIEKLSDIWRGLERLPHVVTQFYRCMSEVERALTLVRSALQQAAEQPVWFLVEGERVEVVGAGEEEKRLRIPIQLAKRAQKSANGDDALFSTFEPWMPFRVLSVRVLGPAELTDVRIGRESVFVASDIGIVTDVNAGARECGLGSRILVTGQRLGVRVTE